MQKWLFVFLMVSIATVSCKKKTSYSNTPKITFNSLNKDSIKSGDSGVVVINLGFEDGDGNIGFGTKNLFLIESRTNDTVPFTIPDIPSQYNTKGGLKGIITIEYLTAFLLLRTDSTHLKRDTLHWDIFMKDKAGNVSNTIATSTLLLKDTL